MDIAAERIFVLWRSFMDLAARSDKATGQKDLSPKGFAKNGPATSLLLSHRSMKDMLLRRASSPNILMKEHGRSLASPARQSQFADGAAGFEARVRLAKVRGVDGSERFGERSAQLFGVNQG